MGTKFLIKKNIAGTDITVDYLGLHLVMQKSGLKKSTSKYVIINGTMVVIKYKALRTTAIQPNVSNWK